MTMISETPQFKPDSNRTPIDYLDIIDKNFTLAVKKGLSRFSVEWGHWSREMNIEIRKRVNSGDSETIPLKYVFVYWVIRSQILELKYRSKGFFSENKIKKRAREAKEISKSLREGSVLPDLSEEEINRRFLGA